MSACDFGWIIEALTEGALSLTDAALLGAGAGDASFLAVLPAVFCPLGTLTGSASFFAGFSSFLAGAALEVDPNDIAPSFMPLLEDPAMGRSPLNVPYTFGLR